MVDGHSGARLDLLPPPCQQDTCTPRWIGRTGSEHHGLVGASAAATGPGASTGVALSSGQRVWIFGREQEPINWFGRVADRLSVLEQPSGIALWGQPFTVDFAPSRPDAGATLLLPFDGSLADPDGQQPLLVEGVDLVPGRYGQGASMGPDSRLHYPLDAFNSGNGTF